MAHEAIKCMAPLHRSCEKRLETLQVHRIDRPQDPVDGGGVYFFVHYLRIRPHSGCMCSVAHM